MDAVQTFFSQNDYAWIVAAVGFVAALLGIFKDLREIVLYPFHALKRRNANRPKEHITSTPVSSTAGMIGRDDKLLALQQVFDSKQQAQITGAAVRGQGGLGKTTLARVFFNHDDFGGRYQGKLWVQADTVENAINDMLGKGCPAFDMAVPEQASLTQAQSVKTRIENDTRRWLVVFDNVDKPPQDDSGEAQDARRAFDQIKSLIPQGSHVDVILTTREALGFGGYETVNLDVLPYDAEDSAAVELLVREAGRDDDRAEARALAEDLGGLPLALEMAGRLIQTHGQTFAFYRENLLEVLKSETADGADYPTSVYGAVIMSYNRLPPEGQEVLKLCAWWAADGLTPELITDAQDGWRWDREDVVDDMGDDLRRLAQDGALVRAGFAVAVGQSLLSQNVDGYGLHRAASSSLRAGPAEHSLAAAAAVLAAQYPGGADGVAHSKNWPQCRLLTPHVRALWESGAAPKTRAMDYLLNQAGMFLSKQGDIFGAIGLYRGGLTLIEARLGEEARDVPVALGNLAQQLVKVGAGREARAMIDRAVALDEAHRPETEDLAASYMQAALILTQLGAEGEVGAFESAAARIQQAMTIRTKLFGADGEPMAHCWNQLGYLKDQQGQGIAAAEAYEKATDIWRGTAPGDARLATSAMNVGAAYLQAGAAMRGEQLLREALEIEREAFQNDLGNPKLRATAQWLTACLLVLARSGDATRAAEARAFVDEFGFDWEKCQQVALALFSKGLFERGDQSEIESVLKSDQEVRDFVMQAMASQDRDDNA